MSTAHTQRRYSTAAISALTALALAACGGGGGGDDTAAGTGGQIALATASGNTPANSPTSAPAPTPAPAPAPAPATQVVSLDATTLVAPAGHSSIARLTSGGYVIAGVGQPLTAAPDRADLCFQGYDASGAHTAVSGCVNVPAGASGVSTAARANGGFTISWLDGANPTGPAAWHSQDYDVNGHAAGAIRSGPPPLAITLAAERLADGGFVKLLFTPQNQLPEILSFQLYAADGAPTGPAKVVAQVSTNRFNLLSSFGPRDDFVVALPGGGFAVTWTQTVDRVGVAVTHAFLADGSPFVNSEPTVIAVGEAMTQVFSADGTPLGDPAVVAPTTIPTRECQGASPVTFTCPAYQQVRGITGTDDGGYIVAWVEGEAPAIAMMAPTVEGTFARRFRADGSPANGVIGRFDSTGSRGCFCQIPLAMATVSPDAFVTLGSISPLQVNAQALR